MTIEAAAEVKYSPAIANAKFDPALAKRGASNGAPRLDPMLASMRPEELRRIKEQLGYSSQSELARTIGVDRSTVSLWMEGRVGVPRPVAKLLRLLQRDHEAQKA